MPTSLRQCRYRVKLTLHVAGPERPRTKYKEHKLLRAEARITLPFVPYPGLYLTFERIAKQGSSRILYLRVRVVEWLMRKEEFVCVVDEMLGSNTFSETFEVRGGPRIEKHYVEIQRDLQDFGFDVQTDVSAQTALNKYPDGTWITPPEPVRVIDQSPVPFRRRRF
jgi:hypothetical protein